MKYIIERIESAEKDLKVLRFLYEKQYKDFKEVCKERDEWKANYEYLRSVLSELSGNIG